MPREEEEASVLVEEAAEVEGASQGVEAPASLPEVEEAREEGSLVDVVDKLPPRYGVFGFLCRVL